MKKIKTIYEILKDYSEEEIDDVIKNLNEEDKNLLYLRYGSDLHNPNFSNWCNEFYKKLLPKLKRILKNKKEGKQLVNEKTYRRIRTIYEILNDYSEEEINDVIKNLNEKDKNLLYLRYGSDLHNPNLSNWNQKYSGRFYKKLLPKLKKKLENKKEGKLLINGRIQRHIHTIYEILKDYSEEEIDDVIKNLNEEDKHIIYLRYGSDLHNPNLSNWNHDYEYQYYMKILPKIKRKLKNTKKDKQKNRHPFTIYEILSNYSKEEIDYVIKNLNKRDRNLIYSTFGNDLSISSIIDYDTKKLLTKIKKYLEYKKEGKLLINGRIQRRYIHTIYEILKDYSEEEIDYVIKNLNEEDKHIIYLRYGNDLHNPDFSNWSMDYHTEFYKKILPKLRRRLDSQKKCPKQSVTIYEYFDGYKNEKPEFENELVINCNNTNLNLLKKVKIIIRIKKAKISKFT